MIYIPIVWVSICGPPPPQPPIHTLETVNYPPGPLLGTWTLEGVLVLLRRLRNIVLPASSRSRLWSWSTKSSTTAPTPVHFFFASIINSTFLLAGTPHTSAHQLHGFTTLGMLVYFIWCLFHMWSKPLLSWLPVNPLPASWLRDGFHLYILTERAPGWPVSGLFH